MPRAYPFLLVPAALLIAPPALAQQRFENLDRIDSLVAMSVGANLGEPGGPMAPVDRRLKLTACPTMPTTKRWSSRWPTTRASCPLHAGGSPLWRR